MSNIVINIFSGNEEYIIDVISVILFLIVVMLVVLISQRLLMNKDVKLRAYTSSFSSDGNSTSDRKLPRNAGALRVARLFSSVATSLVPEGNKRSTSVIHDDLIRAGYFEPSAIAWYYFARVLSSLALPTIGFAVIAQTIPGLPMFQTLLLVVALALFGMILPSLYISRRKAKLAAEFRDGFPEVMDLLVVCVEAGIGISAALSRVTSEIAKTHTFLGANLHVATLELRAGSTLAEAFESLYKRVPLDEVRSLGSLLQQTAELGTSVSDALRAYSSEMREKRYYRAEEKAYSLPAKMALPLGFFVFPVMVTVIMLPVVIRIGEAFFR